MSSGKGRRNEEIPMTETASVAIYHEMRADEDFLETAGMLWTMVHDAAVRFPGARRDLFLDITGHDADNEGDGYDDEAGEVVSFTRAALGPFLTRAPWGKTDEDAPQAENLPDVIVTFGEAGRPVVLTGDRENPVGDGTGMSSDRNLGTATVAAIYVRAGGAFATEQEIMT